MISILYHIITKTAIPLHQNCGLCLAEAEGEQSQLRCSLGRKIKRDSGFARYANPLELTFANAQVGSRTEIALQFWRLRDNSRNCVAPLVATRPRT